MIPATTPYEHDIQAAYVEWVDWNLKRFPGLDLGFAVPNGGARHYAVGAKLRAEGVRSGVPDFMIPAPRNGKTGLAIELKRPGGKLSGTQLRWITRLREEGWQVEVCFTTEAAIAATERYFAPQ